MAQELKAEASITYCQGCLMIKGCKIDDIAKQSIKSTVIPQHFLNNRTKRDGDQFHLTLLTKDEMEKVIPELSFNSKDKKIDHIISKANKILNIKNIDLLNMGVGKRQKQKSTAYYCVILAPQTFRLRRNLKLSNNAFYPHITLAFHPKDLHLNVNKSIETILPKQTDYLHCVALLEITKKYSIKKDTQILLQILELLISQLMNVESINKNGMLCKVLLFRTTVFGLNQQFNDCLNDCLQILKMDEFYVPALISQGIALLAMKRPLEASELFRLSEKILNLYWNAKGDENVQFAQQRLSSLFGEKEKIWLERMKKGIEKCRKEILCVALSPRIRISIKYTTDSMHNGEIPENLTWHETVLPRNFSWLVDGWLCACSIPKHGEQLKTFESMNIGLIVTLFHDALPSHILKTINSENLKCIHLKTANYKAPKLFDVERFIKRAEQCIFVRNKAVLVHCGGGKGRAGTGLACFLLKWGFIFDTLIEVNGNGIIPKWRQPQMSGAEVIRRIQTVRPGSVETREQEQFIKYYANYLWSKMKSTSTENKHSEIEVEPLPEAKTQRDPSGLRKYPKLSDEQLKCVKCKKYPELIILCGIPGSGKTLFCKLMNTLNRQQRDNESETKFVSEWRFANQDKLGKKENVELAVKKWLSAKVGTRIGLIIDRCNVTRKERKHWIEMSFKIKRTVVVYFDIDAKLCKERIHKRKNHPTIQNCGLNRIDKIIADFTKNMEAPTEKEGFEHIYIVKDTNDLLSVCKAFACLPELIRHFIPTQYFKFPRTAHLYDTGAATRDDLRLDGKYSRLYYGATAKTVIVTEKVDGSNIGISLSANYEIQCQHRGSRIVYNSSLEYSKLKDWLDRKSKYLCQILQTMRHILFGEWCQCAHSISYDNLPDYFLVFDLYDRDSQTFVSRAKLENICKGKFSLATVICKKRFENKQQIEALMNKTMSKYKIKSPGPIEGLYLKIDDDDKGINIHRCKLVRSEFIQGITDHWIHKKLEYNTIRPTIQIFDDNDAEEHKVESVEITNVPRGGNKKKSVLFDKYNNLFTANMARSRFAMNLKVICKKLKLNMNELLNVFVIGSRVWLTAAGHSDWDIIIVTDNKNDKVFKSVGNIDAYMLDKHEWRQELNNHRFVCWLTLFLPQEAIWKNDLNIFSINNDNNFVKVDGFSYKLFIDALLKEVDKDCRKINKFFIKNKIDKVHKTFIHTLRMCQITKKIIEILKENYGAETNKNENLIDIKCEKLGMFSFVGMIKFDEIENMVRDKQMQLQRNSDSQNSCKKTVDIWINALKNAGKECLSLIS